MKEVPIFIASSVREFEREREQISAYLDTLNDVHEADGVRLKWYRPEIMSRALVQGGSQLPYNEKILQSRFFVLLIGKELGQHTEDEFNLALEQYKKTGAPLILPYFLNERASMKVLAFQERMRRELSIGEQYVDTYDSLDQILNYLHIELIRNGAFAGDDQPSGQEETAPQEPEAARTLIQEQRDKIASLEAQAVTPRTILEITEAYEKIRYWAQKYKVEPHALYDYLSFLRRQRLYDAGIELGHWLEAYYQQEDPGEEAWAMLKNRMGLCYMESARYEQAERYYKEELEIGRRLAKENPAVYEPDLAAACNHLGDLLKNTNRPEEAEGYYRQALSVYRRLANENPVAYEPDTAGICNNLGVLLHSTNRMEEAERYYREALEIRRRLAYANPSAFGADTAATCNNLGGLLQAANRLEEAEPYYREALKIYRRLAETNSAAFEPDVSATCFNLGTFELKRGNRKKARRYFEEALSVNEKFPHAAKSASYLRAALAKL